MKVTVSKLFRAYHNPITQADKDIVEEFAAKPHLFLDYDLGLAIDIKRMYDKRKAEKEQRAKMDVLHVETVTDKQLEECGVSKREFELIKRLMGMDAEMFVEKGHFTTKSESPFTYTVDLSKYTKIPQDCKEILMRPNKMRILHEKYWRIASATDVQVRDETRENFRKRWHPRKLGKVEDEYKLADRVLEIVDQVAELDAARVEKAQAQMRPEDARDEALARYKQEAEDPFPQVVDGFQHQALLIQRQVKDKGFCTKSQLEYLMLYNEHASHEQQYLLNRKEVDKLKIYKNIPEGDTELADIIELSRPLVHPEVAKKYFQDKYGNLEPSNAKAKQVQELRNNLKSLRYANKLTAKPIDHSKLPQEI